MLLAVEANQADENFQSSQENKKRLHSAVDAVGRPLEVIDLPYPKPVIFDGMRLPASYANFYIANRAVLVPVFNDPADRHALDILAQAFPGREAIGVFAGDLVWGLGTLHCLTQQEPR